MKYNNMRSLKFLLTLAVVCASLVFASQASALLIHDSKELGFVNFGIPSGDADRLTYVNHLVNQAVGTTDNADGQTYTRSSNVFASLPAAVLAGLSGGSSTTIDLGSGLYGYLFAKYDGPNYGSEVWYVGNLSGVITIPAKAGGYGLSGWTLFGPGNGQVPDGGSTVALLGLALLGAAAFRAKTRFA